MPRSSDDGATKTAGIYRKFRVSRTDGSSEPGGKHEKCTYFVLDWQHDPFAIPAALAYADACESIYPELARDLRHGARLATDGDRLAAAAAAAIAAPSPETGTAAVPTCNCRGTLPLDKGTHTGEYCVTPNDTGTAAVLADMDWGRCSPWPAPAPARFVGEDYLRAMPGGHAMPGGPGKPVTTPRQDCLNSCHLVLGEKDWCGVCRGARP